MSTNNLMRTLLIGFIAALGIIIYVTMGYKTAEIHGKVIDATTGCLIRGGLVRVGWSGDALEHVERTDADCRPV